ncbi:MAG: sensor histidine kinase [Chloroflexi bacterium]|nr:sensor histidine kinase [Chloroflexota bacterium]
MSADRGGRTAAAMPALRMGRQILRDVRTLNAFGYFIIFRGITWVIAVVIIATGAAPAAQAAWYPPLLLLTLIHSVVEAFYRPNLQHKVRAWLVRHGINGPYDDYFIIGAFDILLGLLSVGVSGGWQSPFYFYAVVAVMIPGFLSDFAGAFRWATAYAVAFLLVLSRAGGGFEAQRAGGGLSVILSGAATPYLIAIAVSYYGQVSRMLEEEKQRVEAALADNARLAAEKEALAAEQERGRIAREIHDGIAQSLYMLSLQLEGCADLARRDAIEPQLAGRLDNLVGLSRQSLWEVRQFIFDLKPLLAGDRTLAEALQGLAREFGMVSGVSVTFEATGMEPELSAQQRAAAYRILQEGLANVYKHAHANEARVRLAFDPQGVTLEIRDDGAGFAPEQTRQRGMGGYGLPGMRARATELGGELTVESAPGEGACLRVRLPVREGN